jgi:peroxiredoxin
MKTVGDTLHPFELRDHWIILYCYPNNMMPGYSQEALS